MTDNKDNNDQSRSYASLLHGQRISEGKRKKQVEIDQMIEYQVNRKHT